MDISILGQSLRELRIVSNINKEEKKTVHKLAINRIFIFPHRWNVSVCVDISAFRFASASCVCVQLNGKMCGKPVRATIMVMAYFNFLFFTMFFVSYNSDRHRPVCSIEICSLFLSSTRNSCAPFNILMDNNDINVVRIPINTLIM